MSYILFITLFLILVIQLSSIYSFRHVIIIYALIIIHEYLPLLFFYTLIGLLSDDPRFAHPDIGCFISLIRCWWACTLREESEIFLCCLPIFLSLLHFCCLLDSLYLIISRYSQSLFQFSIHILLYVDIYMCYCSDRDLL